MADIKIAGRIKAGAADGISGYASEILFDDAASNKTVKEKIEEVASSPQTMIVTISPDGNDGYEADKTFAEIKAFIDNGGTVIAKDEEDGDSYYYLDNYIASEVVFTRNIWGSGGFSTRYYTIDNTNTVSFIDSVHHISSAVDSSSTANLANSAAVKAVKDDLANYVKKDTGDESVVYFRNHNGKISISGDGFIEIDPNEQGDVQGNGNVVIYGDVSIPESLTVDGERVAVESDIPDELADLTDDSTHRTVTDAEKTTWNGKQNALTFDNVPTANSNNPVKSGGIKTALDAKQDTISDIATIRSNAAAGATAYQKPGTGIPPTDLASAVQTSLGKADTAIQSVTVGTTTTGAAGTNASVTNTGTATEPVLSFTIPQGAQGIQGIQGPQGERGPQGNTGVQVDSVASIIHSIEPTATYAAADVAGADAVQDVLSELTELEGKIDGRYPSDIFAQGYASPENASTVEIVSSSTTRIRTYIINGDYTIRLKSGYVIRSVLGWEGGQTTGHPTDGTFSAKNVANIVTPSQNLTEYTKTGGVANSIITVCKTDANASILPTEDCIDYFTFAEKTGVAQQISKLNQDVSDIQDILNGTATQEETQLPLANGYAAYGESYIDYGESTTRVLSEIIDGVFYIKLKSGYVIRAIVAWNGGQTEGAITADFSISNGTALVSASENLTEYRKENNTYQYAAITICKSNASANISPEEDIVDEFEANTISNIGLIERVTALETGGSRMKSIEKAVFLGDSITHGVYSYFNGGTQTDANRYNGFDISNMSSIEEATAATNIPYYFGKFAGCECINAAKRGSGYVQDGRNLGNALEVATNYDFSDVDFVGLFFGINDYINYKPIGDISTQASGTVIGNMVATITKILTDNPLCKVVVYSPYNSWGQVSYGGDYTNNVTYGTEATNYALGYDKGGGTLQDYIDAEAAVCDYLGIQHVALSKSNVTNRLSLKYVMIDGLHPSKAAWPKLAAEIYGKANFGD